MKRLRLAVVGVGHLGKEHARILTSLPEVELIGVADARAEQAHDVAQRCGTRPFSDYRALLPLIDAAVIAAPTSHHAVIAAEFLGRGIPLLVEKPLAANLEEAERLVDLSHRHGALLQQERYELF